MLNLVSNLSKKSNVAGSEKTEREIQVKTPLNSESDSLNSLPAAFRVRQRTVKHFEEMHFGSIRWQFLSQSSRFPPPKKLFPTLHMPKLTFIIHENTIR